jgi:hypothetical protein
MGLTHLFKISQVPPCLLAMGGAMVVTLGSSSLSPGGKEPPPKKDHLGSILQWLLGMRVDAPIAYVAPASHVYFLELKK